jgi:type IV pilus assembly protein PilE
MIMATRVRSRSAGFTLLELMIVVVIIAILAAIALPAYTKYVQRTRRSDGQSALLNAQQAEEKFFYRCNRYGSIQEIYGNAAPTCSTAFAAGSATDSPQKYYSISISNIPAAPAIGYTLKAAPQGIQTGDQCGNLTVDNTGYKNADGDPSFSNDNDPYRCWH